MAEPFLSELRVFSFGFAPKGWAFCNGQTLPIAQNQALFSLLGTVYGGDGRITFGLPNLQGRVPMHFGNGFNLGAVGGEATHTLSIQEMASHTHALQGTASSADVNNPTGNLLGGVSSLYGPLSSPTKLSPESIGFTGNGQPHQNTQPYLTLNFSIALQGIYPTRS